MHEVEVKTVLMRVSGSRECTSVQLRHRCPIPINLLILKMFRIGLFAFSLQYYQNKQQNKSTVLGLNFFRWYWLLFRSFKNSSVLTELLRSGNTAPLLKISQTGQEIPC